MGSRALHLTPPVHPGRTARRAPLRETQGGCAEIRLPVISAPQKDKPKPLREEPLNNQWLHLTCLLT